MLSPYFLLLFTITDINKISSRLKCDLLKKYEFFVIK